MKWFSNLSLTTKIVSMVVLLGALAVVITVYSMRSLYTVDRDYRALLSHEAQATILLGNAALELSHASRLVFAVLTEQESEKMRLLQVVLDDHQASFIDIIQQVQPLLEGKDAELQKIMAQQQEVFMLAGEVVTWAARWRGDKALNIIYQQYEPSLNLLRQNMHALHTDTVRHYQYSSAELNATTQLTLINTGIAFGVALFAVMGLAAVLSLRYISQPINQLTQVMGRLTLRDYPSRIDYTDRKDEVGQMAQALEVFRDTMRRAEQLEIAEQTAKAKAIFLASMNHEIRTPLNAILGLTRLTLKHPLPEPQKDRLTKIEVAGQHLLEVINSILDFSKMDADHLTLEQKRFHPEQLAQEVNDMLEVRAQEKGLVLDYELAAEMPVLLGDPLRITQILLNYINNAIKFSERGTIRVALRVEPQCEQYAWLYGEVVDQGLGIKQADQARIFSPFEQADGAVRRQDGTGLGLAITRHLAQLMAGEVGVHSAPGVGSCFWFRVRVQLAGESSVASGVPDIVNIEGLRDLRVLLVDDMEVNLLVASELLKEGGLQVDTSSSGQDALDKLASQADGYYAGVLLDLMMPGLDGLETCRRIRGQARFADLPVIAVSAHSSPSDVLACRQVGMNGHVAKPIIETELWRTLHRCLLGDRLDHTGAPSASLPLASPSPASSSIIPAPVVLPSLSRAPLSAMMAPAKAPPIQVLDPQALGLLQRRLPNERFNRLLSVLLVDIQGWQQTLAQQITPSSSTVPDNQVLRQVMHNLVGTAGHGGLQQLLAQAQHINQALQGGDEGQAWRLAADMLSMMDDAMAQLGERFGDSASLHKES